MTNKGLPKHQISVTIQKFQLDQYLTCSFSSAYSSSQLLTVGKFASPWDIKFLGCFVFFTVVSCFTLFMKFVHVDNIHRHSLCSILSATHYQSMPPSFFLYCGKSYPSIIWIMQWKFLSPSVSRYCTRCVLVFFASFLTSDQCNFSMGLDVPTILPAMKLPLLRG